MRSSMRSSATTAAGLVVVADEAAEANWRLAVSDNGIGIPENQLDSDKPRAGLEPIS